MSYTYRCGSCRCQRTFKRKLIIDGVDNKCPNCKNGNFHPFDRDKKRDKERSCYCGQLPFKDAPHRAGSRAHTHGEWHYCVHYKGDPEWEDAIRELGGTEIEVGDDEIPF